MKTSTILKLTGLAAFLGGSYAMYRYISKQMQLLQDSCYKFKNFKFNKLSKDNISISINLLVRNLSKIAFTLKGYNFDIFINDFKVATVSKNVNQNIQANGVSTVGLDINFNPKKAIPDLGKIAEIVSAAAFNRDKFKIRIKGKLNVSQSFISTTQDLDMTFTLTEILSDSKTTTTCKV